MRVRLTCVHSHVETLERVNMFPVFKTQERVNMFPVCPVCLPPLRP